MKPSCRRPVSYPESFFSSVQCYCRLSSKTLYWPWDADDGVTFFLTCYIYDMYKIIYNNNNHIAWSEDESSKKSSGDLLKTCQFVVWLTIASQGRIKSFEAFFYLNNGLQSIIERLWDKWIFFNNGSFSENCSPTCSNFEEHYKGQY